MASEASLGSSLRASSPCFFPDIYLQLGISILIPWTELPSRSSLAQSNIISPICKLLPLMQRPNFCVECGERLARKGWGARLRRHYCDPCTRRLGTIVGFRPIIVIGLIAIAAFAFGRYLRPAPPPLIIQRAANSPLSDSPVELGRAPRGNSAGDNKTNQTSPASVTNEAGYICGARTRKGTPCRRRVHAPGERCFQHQGLAAMVPLEKLVIKPMSSAK